MDSLNCMLEHVAQYHNYNTFGKHCYSQNRSQPSSFDPTTTKQSHRDLASHSSHFTLWDRGHVRTYVPMVVHRTCEHLIYSWHALGTCVSNSSIWPPCSLKLSTKLAWLMANVAHLTWSTVPTQNGLEFCFVFKNKMSMSRAWMDFGPARYCSSPWQVKPVLCFVCHVVRLVEQRNRRVQKR